MKKLNKFILVFSKILEIFHWFAEFLIVVLFILSIAARDRLGSVLSQGAASYGFELSTYGFEMTVVDSAGSLNMSAVTLFFLGAVFILSCMAMVFRNIYLIFKSAEGKTWFAKGKTFFQDDITRMVREIGIFYLSVPVISLVFSILARLIAGPDFMETSVNLSGFFTGFLILALSQVFSYGAKLQNDVDGLL